jgi:Haem-binding uptake, Tiki superfamily, ChaN
MQERRAVLAWLMTVVASLSTATAFCSSASRPLPARSTILLQSHTDENDPLQSLLSHSKRRQFLIASASLTLLPSSATAAAAAADTIELNSVYRPAKRPTAYRVDSTIPPTLLSLSSAREQIQVLKQIASGSGTDKEAIVVDTINLNNILNKAVFGTARFVQDLIASQSDESKSGVGYASYLCLGIPQKATAEDIELARSLLSAVTEARNGQNMAVGLHWAPISTQSALDQYKANKDYAALTKAMTQAGVDQATLILYQPTLEYVTTFNEVDLLALSPEMADLQTAITQGLQQVNPERRSQYVVDAPGFIGMTQQPQFKMYTDRSLFKDVPDGVKEGDFFAQRILAHEAAATVCAKYAQQHSTDTVEPLVAVIAPIQDVRFLVGGINGRLPRVSNAVGLNKVTPNSVTTILCNPTALETLSRTNFLRLEIGTGPETIDLQAKVADYLWFSKSPKVNMIPRLMN